MWGLDFGTGHPFAAVKLAWDRDADVIYITNCIKMIGALPLQHVEAMKPLGIAIPVAWPQDGYAPRDDGAGEVKEIRNIYKKHGLKMLPEHAQFSDGSRSTEAGILEMNERISTNRLKVFKSCVEWFKEFRGYHRKDGLIVKKNDDIMSATRIGVMDRRHAKVVRVDPWGNPTKPAARVAKDLDGDWIFG